MKFTIGVEVEKDLKEKAKFIHGIEKESIKHIVIKTSKNAELEPIFGALKGLFSSGIAITVVHNTEDAPEGTVWDSSLTKSN